MADLSTTILAGTEEMSRASQGLAAAEGAKRQRQTVALEALGESAASMGDTFKKYGDWRKAHQDEKAQLDVLHASQLGQQTKGDAGELTALEATSTPTLGSGQLWQKLHTVAYDRLQARNKVDLETKVKTAEIDKTKAEAAKINLGIDEKNKETEQWANFFKNYTPPENETPEHAQMIQLAKSGGVEFKDFSKYLSMEEAHRVTAENSLKRAQTLSASREKIGQAANAARLTAAGMTNLTRQGIADKDRASRESIENSKLNFHETASWNATQIAQQANAIRQAYDVARIQHMGDRNFRETMRTLLASDQQSLAADRLSAKNEAWGSPEERQALTDSIDTYDKTIKSIQKNLDLFKDKPDQGMQYVPAPDLRGPRVIKMGVTPAQPAQMDDAALDAAIKAAEKVNKK